jgi:hypothetical protein
MGQKTAKFFFSERSVRVVNDKHEPLDSENGKLLDNPRKIVSVDKNPIAAF